MADGTKIEWTDATWNVVNGCTVHSPGCEHCYAMRLAATRLRNHPSRAGLARMHNGHAQWTGEVRFNDAVLLDPLKWRRPRRIFVCAHGDLFHEKVPDEWIDRVFAVMALAPQHQFQVLTKRAGRMRQYLTTPADHDGRGRELQVYEQWRLMREGWRNALPGDREWDWSFREASGLGSCNPAWPLPNVWLGVSVEDQQRAAERIPLLLDTPAAVRWISAEPLLGSLDLNRILLAEADGYRLRGNALSQNGAAPGLGKLDWVVAGGESGAGARPMHPDWARSLRDQCASAGVPFLFKQWGEWAPDDGEGGLDKLDRVIGANALNWADGAWHALPKLISARDVGDDDVYRLGKKAAGRLLDGQLHDGFPA